MQTISLNPIGCLSTCFKTKNGTPRQPSISSATRGRLTIEKSIFNNPEHSLEGLEEFSYVWVIFSFHLNQNKGVKAKVRPPRLDGAKRGIFATRSPHRPNPIGLTLAKLEQVDGDSVTLSGLDIVDGTPILDIKPYIKQYDIPTERNSELSEESEDVKSKSDASLINGSLLVEKDLESTRKSVLKTSVPDLLVVFTPRAEIDLVSFERMLNIDSANSEYMLQHLTSSEELKQSIQDILRADPRSTYRRNKCSDRLYYFTIDKCHVTAWFDYSTIPTTAEVLRIKPEIKILSL